MYVCTCVLSVNMDMYTHKYVHVSIQTFKHIYMPMYVHQREGSICSLKDKSFLKI